MSEDSKLEIVVATKDSLPVRSETGSGLVARGLRDAKIRAELDVRFAALKEALPAIRDRAESGDAQAQYELGEIHYKGEVVPQDWTEAAKWYRRAADQSFLYAHMDLARMYEKGEGVPIDRTEAVLHDIKAADIAVAEFGHIDYNYDSDAVEQALSRGAEHGHIPAALWLIRLARFCERRREENRGWLFGRARDLLKQYPELGEDDYEEAD